MQVFTKANRHYCRCDDRVMMKTFHCTFTKEINVKMRHNGYVLKRTKQYELWKCLSCIKKHHNCPDVTERIMCDNRTN